MTRRGCASSRRARWGRGAAEPAGSTPQRALDGVPQAEGRRVEGRVSATGGRGARWPGPARRAPFWMAALAAAACGGDDEEPEHGDTEAQTPIAAMEVEPRDLSRDLEVSARVEAKTRIELATRGAGVLDALRADEGDRVEKGALLARLDMAEARAELARARAEAAAAERDYERVQSLRERGVASAADYEEARREHDVAKSVEDLWATRVEFSRVSAPRDAVVTERMVEEGEAVEARDALYELTALDDLIVRAGVSELDVVRVEAGQAARVAFDALEGAEMDAEVRRIAPAADRDSQLMNLEIALPEDAADRGVRPGFLARVEIPVSELEDVLAVPSSAVGEEGDQRYVYAIADERLERRDIELGPSRGQLSVVETGLDEGDIVLATNPIDMREGERVRIVGWRSP